MLNKGLDNLNASNKRKIEAQLKALVNQIRDSRVSQKMSQEKMAEELDVSISSIKYIEQGRRIPSLPMILKIANYFGLSLILTPLSNKKPSKH